MRKLPPARVPFSIMAQRVSNGRATGSRVVANQIVEIAAAYATQTAIALVRPCNAAAAQFGRRAERAIWGSARSGVLRSVGRGLRCRVRRRIVVRRQEGAELGRWHAGDRFDVG